MVSFLNRILRFDIFHEVLIYYDNAPIKLFPKLWIFFKFWVTEWKKETEKTHHIVNCKGLQHIISSYDCFPLDRNGIVKSCDPSNF